MTNKKTTPKAKSETKIKLARLKLNAGEHGLPKNPRFIRDDKFRSLCESIRDNPEYMPARPMIADKENNVVLGGNQRLRACRELGMTEVPASWIQFVSGWTLEKKRRFVLLDNRMWGEDDWDILRDEWDVDEMLAAGFDQAILDEMMTDAPDMDAVEGDADAEPEVDRAEELQEKWATAAGQLWLIGEHKLLCGDSTKAEDVGRVMGGEKARMVLTDPPYALFGNSTGVGGIADDKMVRPFFRDIAKISMQFTEQFSHVYVCCDWHSAFVIQLVMQEAGLTAKNLCIWDKGDGGIGANYQICYEMVWFFTNSPKAKGTMAKKETGERVVHGVPNIWRFPRSTKDRQHNAEKPIGLFSVPLSNGCDKGEIVIDLFLGGGTTMVAAQNLNRKCYGLEISPAYCAVILERMITAFPDIDIRKADK